MSSVNKDTQSVAQDLKNEKKIEKNNFLAAYHTLKFSKQDKDCFEVADIERRSLATKYMTAKLYDSEDTAALLLQEGLEDYDTLMKDKDGVNNYWKQIKSQLLNTGNDPSKWKSGLNNVDDALNIIKPLACQETNTLPCKGKSYNDRDIEKLINKSKRKKDASSERNRKIPLQMQANASTSKLQATPSTSQRTNVNKVPVEPNNEPSTSAYFTNIPRSNSVNMHTEQNVSKLQSNTHRRSYQNLSNFVQKLPSKPINNDVSGRIKNLHGPNPCAPKLKPAAASPQFDDEKAEAQENAIGGAFRSARDELYIQEMKNGRGPPKKSLGGRAAVNSQFVCPFKRDKEKSTESYNSQAQNRTNNAEEVEDERLRNIDPNMIELIRNEIMDSDKSVTWDDIAGLEYTKKIVKEVVVFPMLRPDIFTGLRRPPKGILLFGPPGTGKTLIGKCIASQSKSTFFSISASSLTSKWIGEGEKMVRALFAVARVHQPSVVFIDEIDSLLTQRSETEHESSRRLKTEFLVQLDGAATSDDDRVLIVGATNRPQELDEAARRRLVKRLYVPLPELRAREQIINNLLASVRHDLSSDDVTAIAERSAGYSGADMTNLCKEASMEPIRSIPFSQLEDIKMEEVRHITKRDFEEALINVRPSVSQSDLNIYIEWDRTYGSGTAQNYKA